MNAGQGADPLLHAEVIEWLEQLLTSTFTLFISLFAFSSTPVRRHADL